jgi:hypothetical protein
MVKPIGSRLVMIEALLIEIQTDLAVLAKRLTSLGVHLDAVVGGATLAGRARSKRISVPRPTPRGRRPFGR